jgi:hypothetical protein
LASEGAALVPVLPPAPPVPASAGQVQSGGKERETSV